MRKRRSYHMRKKKIKWEGERKWKKREDDYKKLEGRPGGNKL